MSNTFRLLAFISVLFVSTNGISQQRYFVKDARTKTAIPFVKVLPNKGDPILTDIDGMFVINDEASSVSLRAIQYIDTLVDLINISDSVIYLWKEVQEITEVKVTPGVNPAERIIRNAQENRKKNHPLKNDAFTYKSYSKFIFDVDNPNKGPIEDDDTLANKIENYFAHHHLMVAESATRRTFEPPSKDKEEILAFKLSGLSDPSLSTFAQSMQSFNFYDNEFKILGSAYLNPLANDGLRRYLFILEDTLVNGADSTFTIYFRPRKGKNFNGLEGRLYINTKGFAIEKVNVKTYGDADQTDVQIIQEYEFVDNKKWFPVKLSTTLTLSSIQLQIGESTHVIIGGGQTYIDSIEINPEVCSKRWYDNIDLSTSPDATELDESDWKKMRKYDLTEKERRTHHVVDSLSEAENLQDRFDFLKELAKGNIRMGYVSLPIERLLYYNEFEGYRLGLGLETSPKLSKVFKIGGHFGWGTKDKQWKYGGYSTIHINRRRGMKVDLLYQDDVTERGGLKFTEGGFSLNSSELLRTFFIRQMEYQRIAEISFSSDIKANMNVRVFGNYQRNTFTQDYQFIPTVTSAPITDQVDVAEFGVEVKWNIAEKYMMLGNTKVSQGLRFPSIQFMAIRGVKDIWESEYNYWRFKASISQKIKFRDYMTMDLKLNGSKTAGNVPLFLMHNGQGTRVDWMLDVANTFQTMIAGSYYSTEQVAFFTRLKFKEIHIEAKWIEPRFGLHHAIGYGKFDNRNAHVLMFDKMDDGYYEAGLFVDNLLILNQISGFGLGVYYRYDKGADPDWKQNIVPKITFSFAM